MAIQSNNGLDSDILLALIKEDRDEIRIIKNRLYTYMQALIVAAFAITAFFITRCTHDGVIRMTEKIQTTICLSNLGLLILSWIIYLTLNSDLYFVRRCLTFRESQLENSQGYFGQRSQKKGKGFFQTWGFSNDRLPLYLMFGLTFIYAGIIVSVHCL